MSLETIKDGASSEADFGVMNVSSSPHVFCGDSVRKIMWTVTLALAPALFFSFWHFGLPAFKTILVSVIAAVLSEALCLALRGKEIFPTLLDGSAFLTGLLLAMCLPPGVPSFLPAAGSFIAIAIAKHSMGGLGQNIFNPAHIGRAALMLSWPVAMTTWTSLKAVDGVSGATPLSILKYQGHAKLVEAFGGQAEMYKAMFLGDRNGSLGETSIVLLLLGGAYLIYKGYINWSTPAAMIGTVGILTWVFGGLPFGQGLFSGDPLFHMMAGGLVIGAFFMATDMVTTPITRRGQLVFAVGAGAITVLIRLIGGYPEGVCYSILLMNAVTPLIDRLIKPARFGARRKGGLHV